MSKTSTDVKRRYNEKVYKQLNVQIPKELHERLTEACDALGIPIRQAVIMMIEGFLSTGNADIPTEGDNLTSDGISAKSDTSDR